MNDFEVLIPITLFLCIYLSIKTVVETRSRRQMLEAHGADDMLRSILEGEETRRRHGSLRWGMVLVALAIGFGLIEAFGWREPTPGIFALLLGATGLGNLAYFFASRRLK